MTLFRPCIDLHHGKVTQIVGGTLSDGEEALRTNFVSERGAGWYADLYRRDGLDGGHVIQLGPCNEEAARAALGAWPGGLQLGGGITPQNAGDWLRAGASKVIVTSFLFVDGRLSDRRLAELGHAVDRDHLVLDLSCRRGRGGSSGRETWFVATNRWQTVTSTEVNAETLCRLAEHCSEFLVHAADVEGLCQGIDEGLVTLLGSGSPIPCTYAGGARALSDLERVRELSEGRVDLTFGSALDIFGGGMVRYADCVAYNHQQLEMMGPAGRRWPGE